MPDTERPSLIERITRLVLRESLVGITRPAERFVKRLTRSIGLVLGGIAIALIGVAFLAIGSVKWLSYLMPSWLAWIIVGVILFLAGIALTSITVSYRT